MQYAEILRCAQDDEFLLGQRELNDPAESVPAESSPAESVKLSHDFWPFDPGAS